MGGGKHSRLKYSSLPTLHRMHMSDARCRCVLGPVGSGKSSGIIFGEVWHRAIRQEPGADGVRRTRVVMVRNTYSQLETTTLKTFQRWWGFEICTYKNGKTMEAKIHFTHPDKAIGEVDIEVIFLAMDRPEDMGKVQSLEVTWAYINEGREIASWEICDRILERVGRYPEIYEDENGVKKGGCTWSGLVVDSNAPDTDHWIYRKFEMERPDGFEIFHQPPAVLMGEGGTPENPMWELNKGQREGIPAAENIGNIPPASDPWKYYRDMLVGKDYETVRVEMCGEYGAVVYGKPVYARYDDRMHYLPNVKDKDTGKPLDAIVQRGLPVLMGFDFGINWLGCVFAQFWPNGQLVVLDEMLLNDVSTYEFATVHLKKVLNTTFYGMRQFAFSDPAGEQRGQQMGVSNIAMMNSYGIPTKAAPSNKPAERIDAVRHFLDYRIDKDVPGLVLGSKCQMLRKGFQSGYVFKKASVAGGDRFRETPDKNEYSHLHDALQYIALSLVKDGNTAAAARQVGGWQGAFGLPGGASRLAAPAPVGIDCGVC